MVTGIMAQRYSSFLTNQKVEVAATETPNPAEAYRETFEATEEPAAGPFWNQAEVAPEAPPQPQGPSEVDLQIRALLARTESELNASRCQMTTSQLEAGRRSLETAAKTSDELFATQSFTPSTTSYNFAPMGTATGRSPAGGPSLAYQPRASQPPRPTAINALGYGLPPAANGYRSRY